MRNQQPRNLLAAMALAGLIGCAGETTAPTDQVTITAQVSLALSINNPATVTVHQNTLQETTFIVTNVGTVSGTANVACSSFGAVTCAGVFPSSFVIAPGASQNVLVEWNAGVANPKTSTLSLRDTGTGAKGTQSIKIIP
jgi:hypothetical protein